ncbi:MAG: hypothetical protein ACTSR8_10395 [Promethearchaeota archaeon]
MAHWEYCYPYLQDGFVGTLEKYRGRGFIKKLNILYEQIIYNPLLIKN